MTKTVKEQYSASAETPLVSVVCITYNHNKYIGDAIEGFLMQRTTFPVEIIVHDDCSTDGTADIVREYFRQSPRLIVPVLQEVNQRSQGKKILPMAIEKARGQYLALCEGDDYWIDPMKLQKQVSFLNEHSEYGMVCTNYDFFIESKGRKLGSYSAMVFGRISQMDLTYEGYLNEELRDTHAIATATVLYRKSLYESFIREIGNDAKHWPMGDAPIFLYAMQASRVRYLPDVTTVYRRLPSSASNIVDPDKRNAFAQVRFEMFRYFMDRYGCEPATRTLLERCIAQQQLSYAYDTSNRELMKATADALRRRHGLTRNDKLKYIASLNRVFGAVLRPVFDVKESLNELAHIARERLYHVASSRIESKTN